MKKRIFVLALGIATTSFMISCGGGAKKEAPAAELPSAPERAVSAVLPTAPAVSDQADGLK